MICVESPDEPHGFVSPSLFLAGGITSCPDWQSYIVGSLDKEKGLLLNPRRKNFPIHDPSAAPAQIAWEFRQLRRADAVLFWFPCETLCPIVLYELGAWSMMSKQIFVGTHPRYARRLDVELQTKWARPDVSVVHGLDELAAQVKRWLTR